MPEKRKDRVIPIRMRPFPMSKRRTYWLRL